MNFKFELVSTSTSESHSRTVSTVHQCCSASVNLLSLFSSCILEEDSDDDFDVGAEPDLLTPSSSQREQFAERFDRWLQNLRQQQLRLFSSCTSRVGNVENDKEADPEPEPEAEIEPKAEPEPEPEPEPEIELGTEQEVDLEPEVETRPEAEPEADPDSGTGTDLDVSYISGAYQLS